MVNKLDLSNTLLKQEYKSTMDKYVEAGRENEKLEECDDYLKLHIAKLKLSLVKEEKEMLFNEMKSRRLIT